MWELAYKESWVLKNWCFQTVVLEKTLESPLDWKEIQPVHSEGDLPWYFFGRNYAKAETPVLCPLRAKSWLIGKGFDAGSDWGQEEKGMTENEMAGWDHWLNGREYEWTLGDGDGQGGLACCDSWGFKESGTTEWLNWNECKIVGVSCWLWLWEPYLWFEVCRCSLTPRFTKNVTLEGCCCFSYSFGHFLWGGDTLEFTCLCVPAQKQKSLSWS